MMNKRNNCFSLHMLCYRNIHLLKNLSEPFTHLPYELGPMSSTYVCREYKRTYVGNIKGHFKILEFVAIFLYASDLLLVK